jgi:hypothetical protein
MAIKFWNSVLGLSSAYYFDYLLFSVRQNCPCALTEHHAIKAYWWRECISPLLTSGARATFTHWIGGWVGPRTGLDAVVEEGISQPLPGLEPPFIQAVAQRYTAELSDSLSLLLDICHF